MLASTLTLHLIYVYINLFVNVFVEDILLWSHMLSILLLLEPHLKTLKSALFSQKFGFYINFRQTFLRVM